MDNQQKIHQGRKAMKIIFRTLLIFTILIVNPDVSVQAGLVIGSNGSGGFGSYHALVIGNQNYKHLPVLQTPLADAKAVAEVLEKQYGFKVTLLLDATFVQARRAIYQLRKTVTGKQDNLLIYYAGHGHLDKVSGTGYWQPVDAEKDNDVFWIRTDPITDLLKVSQARHILVVADSCYSGSLVTRSTGAELHPGVSRKELLQRMLRKRSRTALTSGGEEPVLDSGGGNHSVFAKAFIRALQDNQGILDGDTLFEKVRYSVHLNADQTPMYENIRKTGHDYGDFLLVPEHLQAEGLQVSQKKSGNGLDRDLIRGEVTTGAPNTDFPSKSKKSDIASTVTEKKCVQIGQKSGKWSADVFCKISITIGATARHDGFNNEKNPCAGAYAEAYQKNCESSFVQKARKQCPKYAIGTKFHKYYSAASNGACWAPDGQI